MQFESNGRTARENGDLKVTPTEFLSALKIKSTMNRNETEPWQIAAARYCVGQGDKEFTEKQLIEALRAKGYRIDDWHIKQFFYEEVKHPAGTQFDRGPRGDNGVNVWAAPLQLVSTVIDFDELRHARQSAQSALKMAILALIVSGAGSIFQALSFFLSGN